MKKLCVTTAIFVFLFFLTDGIQGQPTQQIDQVKLMKQMIGTWQANKGKDTVEVWECSQYGPQAFVINVSLIIKGQKVPFYINNVSFNPREGKLRGFSLYVDGTYGTWIGGYTSETKSEGVLAQDFVPQPSWGKYVTLLKNPKEYNWVFYNGNGVKTSDLLFVKVK
jgi:hypothetical protein